MAKVEVFLVKSPRWKDEGKVIWLDKILYQKPMDKSLDTPVCSKAEEVTLDSSPLRNIAKNIAIRRTVKPMRCFKMTA